MKNSGLSTRTGYMLGCFALGVLFSAAIFFLFAPLQALESKTVNPFIGEFQTNGERPLYPAPQGQTPGFEAVWTGDFHSPSINGSGRYVAFCSDCGSLVPEDTNETSDVFVRDLQTGRVERVSVGPGGLQANGPSERPYITPNGRYIVFESRANNLCPLDTESDCDLYVHDRWSGKTNCVSTGNCPKKAETKRALQTL